MDMQTVFTYVPSYEHHFPNHPERVERFEHLDIDSIPGIVSLPFAEAPINTVRNVHSKNMLEQLETACKKGTQIIDGAPTYVTSSSYQAALQAAGACLAVGRAVLSGSARNGFSLVRPPGHHAEPDCAMGFCLLNNAAIICMDALEQGVGRVMVVDYDAHHGNGTQKALIHNPRTAYFSTHQENIYPGSGWLEEAPHARGRIANFPLPANSGDVCFDLVFEQALRPMMKSFAPEFIIVSAGFDAHWKDPLTSMGLSTAGYYNFSRKLIETAAELCAGRIVFVLEGGYNAWVLASCVRAVFAALTGVEPGVMDDLSKLPEPDIHKRIEQFKKWHSLS